MNIARIVAACAAACVTCASFAASEEPALFELDERGSYVPLRERHLTRQGDEVKVFYDGCRHQKVDFDEKERHSRIYEDFRAILRKDDTKVASVDCPTYVAATHRLRHKRGTLTATAIGKDEKDTKAVTLITGPEENWYLSLDLPLTSRKTLKYDSGTRTLQPQDDKPQLYLSLNWQLGDVLTKREALGDWERISFKALVLADNRPLDSFGLGVGFQVPPLLGRKLDLSAVTLFLGHFWTKQDAVSDAGEPQLNESRKRQWRLGISFDVGAGLKYLK